MYRRQMESYLPLLEPQWVTTKGHNLDGANEEDGQRSDDEGKKDGKEGGEEQEDGKGGNSDTKREVLINLLPKMHKDPTQRFNVLMPEIIVHCEHLGAETGCCLIVAGAHKGPGAQELHYTTTTLCADAPKTTTKILNDFRVLIAGIKQARHETAVSMGMALTEAESAQAAAEEKARQAELRLAEQQAELDTLGARHHLQTPEMLSKLQGN
ncbi:hypothetical protein B0H19DRAFT_1058952 [Mycena capillaripes]|nr:hypothetical protein B0H19DRAFT_1058952 [Mycena capillaripes]